MEQSAGNGRSQTARRRKQRRRDDGQAYFRSGAQVNVLPYIPAGESAMKLAKIPLLILLCATSALIAPAQQAPAKTESPNQTEQIAKREGAITGRVIGPDGQPAPDAVVSAYRISESPGSRQSAASDDAGNFKLTGLRPGAYVLSAGAPGYVAAEIPIENAIH